jgi:hypothetical protein
MIGRMEWLTRMRWRLRGAWMWPAFLGLTVVDGLIGHWLPPTGDSQGLGDALISAAFYNLIAVAALARMCGWLLRRRRKDLPKMVAADYAGTTLLVAVLGVFVVAGLVHRSTILQHRRMLKDAIARAEAFIGDRAPAEFRVNATHPDTYTIQAGASYRVCVPSRYRPRYYCVIVDPRLPLASSVKPAGSEPNWTLALGTD